MPPRTVAVATGHSGKVSGSITVDYTHGLDLSPRRQDYLCRAHDLGEDVCLLNAKFGEYLCITISVKRWSTGCWHASPES